MRDLKTEILGFMKEAGRPITLKGLIQSLGVETAERNVFKKSLKGLVREGAAVKIRGERYGLPSKMNLVTGELSRHPDGYGFVAPETGEGEDVFINPRRLSGAMHGDTVVARVEGLKSGGKKEGSIIRILKRANKTVVGRFTFSRNFGVVVPSDTRLTGEIIIPSKDTAGAKNGVIVEAEITKWPDRFSGASGKVIEIIGDPKDADVEAEVILRKFGLPIKFPPEVMAEAKGVSPVVTAPDIAGRVDLRGIQTVTIDGETAKDFDDAVSVEKTQGGYKLRVSIADVSHYVSVGSLLDVEAYERGTSVYFPDRCTPMLPEALSNGICSLIPREDRLTLTADMDFDGNGNLTRKKFYESVIKSRERLTYTLVKNLLKGEDASLTEKYSHIRADLTLMEELALKLFEKRFEAGSIDFDLPEPQIIIDIEGRVEDIARSERNVAHRIIEEFMLAANKAVATEFSANKLPFLYRVHAEPDEEDIEGFIEFAGGLGVVLKRDGGPKAFQQVLKTVAGTPLERLVNHVLLRSMKQAEYSNVNVGHFGLAFGDYTHFTSPIRRYPDLVVHRLLKARIRGRYNAAERARMEVLLPEIAGRCSKRERKAMEAERESVDLKKVQFMKDKTGEVYPGFVSGVTSFGLFVELKEYFVEGLIHVSALTDDYYIYDEKRHTLTGERTRRRFRPGDEVTVVVNAVDIERRRIDLLLEGQVAKPPKSLFKKGAGSKGGLSTTEGKFNPRFKRAGAGKKGKRR
ncbi:MAG: ribonuclease R [Deltaproteobacteria bacterium]|nr:ribonuclease R [Deltaproteobacteria bacterium]